jgi:TIR domain-containing protein
MPEQPTSGLRIFVSYRHEDAPAQAGRITDNLVARFGQPNVFMDVDAIDPGLDFRVVLKNAIQSCDVLIAVIGREWLSTKDTQGTRRLDNPNDYVRLEIEAALEREIRVIPLLVDGARIPEPDEVPSSLVPLCFRNAVEVGRHFHLDVSALVKRLETLEAETKPGLEPPPDRQDARVSARDGDGTSAAHEAAAREPLSARIGRMRKDVPSTIREHKALSVVAVFLLAGAVVAGIALTGGGQSSTTADGGAVHGLEALVPFFAEWNCQEGESSSAEVIEEATCSPEEGAEDVHLILFENNQAMRTAYKQELTRAARVSPSPIKADTGQCNATSWGGEGAWEHAPGVQAGRKLCYIARDHTSHLIWTYADADLLVNADRPDEAHGQLSEWWDSHAHEIAAGGEEHMH